VAVTRPKHPDTPRRRRMGSVHGASAGAEVESNERVRGWRHGGLGLVLDVVRAGGGERAA